MGHTRTMDADAAKALSERLLAAAQAGGPVVITWDPAEADLAIEAAGVKSAGADSAVGRTLRRFSTAGPCLTRGVVVRETAKFLVYRDRWSQGAERRVKKDGERLVHTRPCVSCTDHPKTQYPHGYMD